MLTTDQVQHLIDSNGHVVDTDGDKIGKVGQIFLDEQTGDPAWVTVKTGMFGGAESFVPLDRASVDGDNVVVPFGKDVIKDAPRVDDADGHLSRSEEDDLYRYYGVDDQSGGRVPQQRSAHEDERVTGTPTDAVTDAGTEGRDDVRGDDRDDVRTGGDSDRDQTMVRSEEQLHVGTTTENTGKARMRKYIVTEDVTTTVPVSHEEVRLEREPIAEGDRTAAGAGAELTEEDHEMDLKGERVVVDKENVPVERISMGTETVTEDQTVTEQVRKEQVETDRGTDSER